LEQKSVKHAVCLSPLCTVPLPLNFKAVSTDVQVLAYYEQRFLNYFTWQFLLLVLWNIFVVSSTWLVWNFSMQRKTGDGQIPTSK